MKNNKQNIKTDKFIITGMEGITIIKKEESNVDKSEEVTESKGFDNIDLDNLPWEGNNYSNEIDYDDLI